LSHGYLSNAKGSGFIRWDSRAFVRSYATCFLIDDQAEEIAIIPKQYLRTTEMLLLQKRVMCGLPRIRVK